MAEQDDSLDKQHAPTPKRLTELRRKGMVLRSKDLNSGLIFFSGMFTLLCLSHYLQTQIANDFIEPFKAISFVMTEKNILPNFLKMIATKNLILLLPIFSTIIAVLLFSPFLFGGWNFSLSVMQLNFGKLNPLANLSRVFAVKTSGPELFKAILKSFTVLSLVIYYIYVKKSEICGLINLPAKIAFRLSLKMTTEFILLISMAVVVFIVIDSLLQFFKYHEQIKMSIQEIKDEAKDAEGNMGTKRKIRSKQLSLHRQRLRVDVPKATVIITNPTHYAIALRYQENLDRAPKVVAKGQDFLAQQIRQIAALNGVPIYSAPSLARAIYYSSKVGMEINPGLYMAVAMVLSYVHQLRRYQMGAGKHPTYIEEFEIPKELQHD